MRFTLRISNSPVTGRPDWSAGSGDLDQLPVERVRERRFLRARAPQRHVRRGRMQDAREIDPARLPVLDGRVGLEQVHAADEVVEPGDPEPGHDPARLLRDEEEEVHDVLGLALEAPAQLGILRRDPDRARVQVAGAHHHAARRDQRRGREAHLVRAEQRCHDDVAAGLELAVGLHPDPRAQVVEDERLLRLGEPDLPRDPGEEDRRERRRARSAVVARR